MGMPDWSVHKMENLLFWLAVLVLGFVIIYPFLTGRAFR